MNKIFLVTKIYKIFLNSREVEWFNSPRKFAADWEHETVFLDRDGSLTETGVPGYSVVPYTELYPASMCSSAPEFSIEFPVMICNSIEYNRFGVNNILPKSFNGFSMIIKNRWGESVIPFRRSRSTHGFGWMGILLSGEHHDIWWVQHEHISNVTYSKVEKYKIITNFVTVSDIMWQR